jgi:hypothetical protein
MVPVTGSNSVAEFLQAIADVIWPLVVLAAILLLRDDLRQLLRRLRRGRFFGQEFELEESLDRLEKRTDEAEAEVPPEPIRIRGEPVAARKDELTDQVFSAAQADPRLGLMLLASEMEGEMRRLLASLGALEGRQFGPFLGEWMKLARRAGLPESTASVVSEFWRIRNNIVHGRAVPDEVVLRAIDLGLGIMRIIRSIPHETYTVAHVGIPLYEDPGGTSPRNDVRGLILETTTEDGRTTRRVFPTTRQDLQPGQRVAWEWNMERTWGETWYRDPDSGQLAYAWTSSAEFVGRPLDEV